MYSKVLACVIWGRLKNAFQIASRSESASDVQYVAREVSTQPTLVLINYVLDRPPQGSCFDTLGNNPQEIHHKLRALAVQDIHLALSFQDS